MADDLPDEILKEILTPVLRVPDSKFSSISLKSPFANSLTQSSSVILTVCKRWLRVATPMLYHTVVLRSTAQAQALARTFKANSQLGIFVRRLRVEGGFGVSMDRIITSMPNVTHLSLSLMIHSDDNVSGLCHALSSMNPVHVILQKGQRLKNMKVKMLANELAECIMAWTNMKTFLLPHLGFLMEDYGVIAGALSRTPHIETIYTYMPDWVHAYILGISRNPHLKAIEIIIDKESHPVPPHIEAQLPPRVSFVDLASHHPRLRALLVLPKQPDVGGVTDTEMEDVATESPMASTPDNVRDKIWGLILTHAFDLDHQELELSYNAMVIDLREDTSYVGWEEMTQRNLQWKSLKTTRWALPLVSKCFNRIATPLLYSHPIVSGVSALRGFANRLVADPSLGLHVRALLIHHLKLQPMPEAHASSVENLQLIVSRVPGLVTMYGGRRLRDLPPVTSVISIDWDGFVTLAKTAGSNLLTFHDFEIVPVPTIQSPSIFNRFTNLRSLDWNGAVKFKCTRNQIPPDCLSTLETLRVRFLSNDTSFLEVLSHMQLPRLSHVALSIPLSFTRIKAFLRKHGEKLRELELETGDCSVPVFDLCPNVVLLQFYSSSEAPEAGFFQCKTVHKCLEQVRFPKNWGMYDKAAHWTDFFEDVDLGSFPALREFHVRRFSWPTTEYEIAKDPWVRWAELLMQWNVKLLDIEGKSWVPRLKKLRR